MGLRLASSFSLLYLKLNHYELVPIGQNLKAARHCGYISVTFFNFQGGKELL